MDTYNKYKPTNLLKNLGDSDATNSQPMDPNWTDDDYLVKVYLTVTHALDQRYAFTPLVPDDIASELDPEPDKLYSNLKIGELMKTQCLHTVSIGMSRAKQYFKTYHIESHQEVTRPTSAIPLSLITTTEKSNLTREKLIALAVSTKKTALRQFSIKQMLEQYNSLRDKLRGKPREKYPILSDKIRKDDMIDALCKIRKEQFSKRSSLKEDAINEVKAQHEKPTTVESRKTELNLSFYSWYKDPDFRYKELHTKQNYDL